jgi:hypothetical protein
MGELGAGGGTQGREIWFRVIRRIIGEGDKCRRVEEGVGIDEEKREDDMTSYLKCS